MNSNLTTQHYPTELLGRRMIVPHRGIKIHYIYYWSDQFSYDQHARRLVEVKWAPQDIAVIFARLDGAWMPCYSEYYSALHGHTLSELLVALRRLRQRHRRLGR